MHSRETWLAIVECHIRPDWLLMYKLTPGQLILVRTGSHSNLTTGDAGLSKVRLLAEPDRGMYAAKRTRLQLRPFLQLVHFAPTATWLREGD